MLVDVLLMLAVFLSYVLPNLDVLMDFQMCLLNSMKYTHNSVKYWLNPEAWVSLFPESLIPEAGVS